MAKVCEFSSFVLFCFVLFYPNLVMDMWDQHSQFFFSCTHLMYIYSIYTKFSSGLVLYFGTRKKEKRNNEGRKDGWMDGWMDGWKDGWMDGWKEGMNT